MVSFDDRTFSDEEVEEEGGDDEKCFCLKTSLGVRKIHRNRLDEVRGEDAFGFGAV